MGRFMKKIENHCAKSRSSTEATDLCDDTCERCALLRLTYAKVNPPCHRAGRIYDNMPEKKTNPPRQKKKKTESQSHRK